MVQEGPAPKPGEPKYKRFAKTAIERAFYRELQTVEETRGERTMLAWRISRSLAMHLGLCDSSEPLRKAMMPTQERPDAWGELDRYTAPYPSTPLAKSILDGGNPAVVKLLSDAYDPDRRKEYRFGVRPPTTPEGLDNWKTAIKLIDHRLGLSSGSPEFPDLASVALPQILERPRDAWPSEMEILDFEDLIVSEVLLAITGGDTRAQIDRSLVRGYGFTRFEVRYLLDLASQDALGLADMDAEEARALMVLRLEDLASRSKNALDLRAELGTLKQLAVILGLSRIEGGDAVSEFTNVIKSVANEAGNRKKLNP
jgi:hypothetical protein